jgi:hypothetical protein
MPKRIALSTLNASTLDILNVIRQNASYEYQSQVPVVTKATDIPKVGEILYGTPALANQFINALINRIALYRIKSATFNNPYERFKKGYLEFGETVEEVFVNLIKPLEYSAEKGEAREHKRYLPDVRSAFHVMNWRVLYPVTIQDDDLKMAFLSIDGVRDLIEKIVGSIYTSANYDEYLLFKYLLIKAISHGKMYPQGIDVSDDKNAAIAFRGTSNMMTFMRSEYNNEGVLNTTPKERQAIFMDAKYNAQFDVNVLASAFNMDKAELMGKLELIDDWTTFDNDRFEIIRANSDGLEEVTADELALMADTVAVLVDEEWFQVYDNENKMTEQYTASGLYWNYFYHVWKTISFSPFHNAVVFVKSTATLTPAESLTFVVANKDESEEGMTTLALLLNDSDESFVPTTDHHDQTEDATQKGVAVQTWGGYIFPATQTSITAQVTVNGKAYTATVAKTASVGDEITFNAVD